MQEPFVSYYMAFSYVESQVQLDLSHLVRFLALYERGCAMTSGRAVVLESQHFGSNAQLMREWSRGVNTLASFLFVRQFWAEFYTASQRIGGGVRGWTEPQLPRAVNHLLTLPFLSHFSTGSQCFLRSPHGHHLK